MEFRLRGVQNKAVGGIAAGALTVGLAVAACGEGGVEPMEGYQLEVQKGTDVFNATTNAVVCGTVQETVTLGSDDAREYYPPLRRTDELNWFQVDTDALELQNLHTCMGVVVVPASEVEVVPVS